MGFCSDRPYVYCPNLKSAALSVPEIIGGTHKIWIVPEYAHAPFSPKCLTGFCSDGPYVSAKFEVRSFTLSRDNSDWSFGWGCERPILGKRTDRMGSGMVPFERAFVSSYRPSMHGNFSSIFTRFRDIADFVLQHTTFPHHTSSLLKTSPCSPGSRWMAFGLRRAKVLG